MIKESQLYISFVQSFFLMLISTTLIGLLVGLWLAVGLKSSYSAQRLFQFPYTEQNAVFVEKQSNEAVSVLRSSQLKEDLGIQQSQVIIFKPSAFLISIQVVNENAEEAVESLSKLVGFFSQSYLVTEIGSITLTTIQPPFLRFLTLGSLVGFLLGLFLSLVISYFRKY